MISVKEQIHRSEVRTLIRWRIESGSWNRITEFLNKPAVKARADKLKKDIKEQITKGNKGTKGEWIET